MARFAGCVDTAKRGGSAGVRSARGDHRFQILGSEPRIAKHFVEFGRVFLSFRILLHNPKQGLKPACFGRRYKNSTVVQHLLDDLIERGLDATQPMLIVLDGSKALRKAVDKTFGDRCAVQRCQIHKRRNVKDHLPAEYQGSADQRIRTAYAMRDYEQAKEQLLKTVAWLEGINPSAASSLKEGLEETLTLHRLGLPEPLRKSLQSTNLIESALSVAADVTGRVKRWRGGDMRLRWSAAGLLMAEKRFRRVRGYKLMPKLFATLDAKADAVAQTPEAA